MSQLVVSPDVVIRIEAGRLCVHAGMTEMRFEEQAPAVLALLSRFRTGAQLAEVVDALPEATQGWAHSLLAEFSRSGVLVPWDAKRSGEAGGLDGRMGVLAEVLSSVAGDLAAFDQRSFEAITQRTGLRVEDRLNSLLAAAQALAGDLRAQREPHVARQLEAAGIDEGACGLKVHLGSGSSPLDGWINVDVHPSPFSIDLRWGLPFADGSVAFVFLSHVFEHLHHPFETNFVLAEVRRVLQPGGVVRIVVPDLEKCLRAYVERDDAFFSGRREAWPDWPEVDSRLEDFLHYAGAGAPLADYFRSHKYGYDFETLEVVLKRSGFDQVERSTFLESRHEALRVDHASTVAGARYGAEFYSLFVEGSVKVPDRMSSGEGQR